MSDEEFVTLNTQEMTEESARVLGIDIIKEDIDIDRAEIKKNALISAVLSAGVLATGMNDPFSYTLMGVDSVFLFQLFQKLHAIYQKKKALKQFEGETYKDSYVDFIKKCQEHVSKRCKPDMNEKSR